MSLAHPDRLELADLEWFIELGGLVGYKQFGFSEIRARQDAELTEQLRQLRSGPHRRPQADRGDGR